MKDNSRNPTKEWVARIFGVLSPSAAELTAHAEADAAAELACARTEAGQRVQAAERRGRAEQQAAVRQMGLDALDAAIWQGNPKAARQALDLLEREYDR